MMRAIAVAILLAYSTPAAALDQGCYPEFSGYYSAPNGGEMDLHPRATTATVRAVSFEAIAEVDVNIGLDYIAGLYVVEILEQKDEEGIIIDREYWPYESLFIQGVDYDDRIDRVELGHYVMRSVIIFRSEFWSANICGWRPHLNLGGIYQIRADAIFGPDTFTAVSSE